ncbi:MAG TPA: PilZ domain-containing protein [Thermodesulfatator atlanticus]|uniref:PilZ domain-containing protein n=1 Tax=Thermodesulfatator atlanticus TaxID=501497 RepID=A0A7V5U329_9BACT|nr:PilZ domain-containing protein [Thermodesulfatator atlanticus]
MSEEKRRFIRIYDRVLLRLKPLAREEFEQKLANFREGKERPWIDPVRPPGEVVKFESFLKRLRERDRELAGILQILNQKLDRILIHLLGKEFLKGFQEVEANISAGGLRVRLDNAPQPGQLYEIDLGLLPDWIFLKTFGEVIRVDECEEGGYEVAFKFVWITEADQDKLVQHIFRQQVLQIQASKRVKT